MSNEFSPKVEKIVQDYLNQIGSCLKDLPKQEKEELIRELYSHIYEAYDSDPTEDEIERISNVFEKMGEPTEVFSTKIPSALKKISKQRKFPLFYLSALLIAILAFPLGLSGTVLLLCIAIFVPILVFVYYLLASVFLVTGPLFAIASVIQIVDPNYLSEYIKMFDMISNRRVGGIVGLISSILLIAIGLGLFRLGRRIFRGIRFLIKLFTQRIQERRDRRRFVSEQSEYY